MHGCCEVLRFRYSLARRHAKMKAWVFARARLRFIGSSKARRKRANGRMSRGNQASPAAVEADREFPAKTELAGDEISQRQPTILAA